MNYMITKCAPNLTKQHMQNRVARAETYVSFTQSDWDRLIFPDEIIFNLDDPHGCAYYWNDLHTNQKLFFETTAM